MPPSKKIKTLVIVESPTKAKTIAKMLGREFSVKSSFGHIRDLPKSNMGIDLAHDFDPQYVIPKEKQQHVTELKAGAKAAGRIILATDEDREGEAIAWHLAQALGLESAKGKAQNPLIG
ncbi:toprim domain-containing protein [Candidatus Uhrbacteria bacterium]|nr:toprim domain-containing protein [Candidatus Uhrbacteria bacterium]